MKSFFGRSVRGKPSQREGTLTPSESSASSPASGSDDDGASTFVSNADRPDSSANVRGLLNEGLEWHHDRVFRLQQSERKAWNVAKAAVGGCLLLGGALAALMPLKSPGVPYLWREDIRTGRVELLTVLDDEAVGFEEVRDQHWLARYVKARETYDYHVIQADYDLVLLLSSSTVGADYKALYQGEHALDTLRQDRMRITVEITSVVPNGKGGASVRYTTTTHDRDKPSLAKPLRRSWVATIGYRYNNPSTLPESERLENPFAFQVISFRTDEERL